MHRGEERRNKTVHPLEHKAAAVFEDRKQGFMEAESFRREKRGILNAMN